MVDTKDNQKRSPGNTKAPEVLILPEHMTADQLTQCHVFARHYVASGFDRTKAGGLLKPDAKNYREVASKMLKFEETHNEIQNIVMAKTKNFDVTAERVLKELAFIAFADISELYNDDGTVKNLMDITPEARRLITAIETVDYYEGYGANKKAVGVTKRIKLASKEEALELLGKYLKMFTDKVEVEGLLIQVLGLKPLI